MLRKRMGFAAAVALSVVLVSTGCGSGERKAPPNLPNPTYTVARQTDCTSRVTLKPAKGELFTIDSDDVQTVNVIRDLCGQPAKVYDPGTIRPRKSRDARADSVTADGCLVPTAEQSDPSSPKFESEPLCFQPVPTEKARKLANGKYSGAHGFNMVRKGGVVSGGDWGIKNPNDEPREFAWHHTTAIPKGGLDYFYVQATAPTAYQALVVMPASTEGEGEKGEKEAEEHDDDAQVWFVDRVVKDANGTRTVSFVLSYHGTFEQLRKKPDKLGVIGSLEARVEHIAEQWAVYRAIAG